MNTLHAMIRDYNGLDQASSDDAERYNELSRLNNELANTQRELAKQNAALQRLNALKNQFLGMVAHDIRSPLSVLLNYSEYLLDDLSNSLDAQHLEFLEAIHSSTEFMLRLVNDLLDISVIESGRLELNIEPTDLAELIRHCVTLDATLAQKKGIALSMKQAGALPLMAVDPSKIRQVLDNLVANAIQYSHPGTAVNVHVARQGPEVVIAVQDQGQGIPADELHMLFQWLGKTSVRGTNGEKSSGLGLAIARRIVEGHEGRIWAESEVGRGSTFYVALPIIDQPADAAER